MTPAELAARLDAAADNVGPAIDRHLRRVGAAGVAQIKSNASGRPGPMVRNTENPNYRDSWKDVYRAIPHGAQCTIGTSKPQGKRLEFGFYDMTDSIGRHYFQPPFPHVQPAISMIGAMLRARMREAAEEVFE